MESKLIRRAIRVAAISYGFAALFVFVQLSLVIGLSIFSFMFRPNTEAAIKLVRGALLLGGAWFCCIGLWRLKRWAVYWTLLYNATMLYILFYPMVRLIKYPSLNVVILVVFVTGLIVVSSLLLLPRAREVLSK